MSVADVDDGKCNEVIKYNSNIRGKYWTTLHELRELGKSHRSNVDKSMYVGRDNKSSLTELMRHYD